MPPPDYGVAATPAPEARPSGIPGRRRNKKTARSVIVGEKIAGWSITVGGLLVILAVVGIMVFLVRVALPLAAGGSLEGHRTFTVQPPKPLAWVNADEYRTLGVRVTADGLVSSFHLGTGRPVSAGRLDFGDRSATAVGGVVRRDQLAFAFDDGSVRFGTAGFDVQVIPAANLPPGLQPLDDRDRLGDGAVFSLLPGNQFRRVELKATIGDPQKVADAPIVAIDYRIGGTVERPTRSFVTFDARGEGRISRAETRVNLLTRKEATTIRSAKLTGLPAATEVTEVAMTSHADAVYVASAAGRLYRFDTRNFDAPVLAETLQVFPDGVRITALQFLVGEQALVVGGSNGAVDVFFRLQAEGVDTVDGYHMVRARSHRPHTAAVVDIAVSERSKALVTQAANGEGWVRHSTSDQVLFEFAKGGEWSGSSRIMLTPRVDGAVLVDDSGEVNFWAFKFPHPETTLRTIFGKVWYEGYAEPTFTWQSSSGTDVFEAKFSLVPLIFGTVKATVYSLLFAVPIALLGAIYTSEFVHRRVRATVKPTMEMMEALPTVILGFIAALILAPLVENWVAAVLLAFIALPIGLMLAAYLWQMLPPQLALKLDGLPKFGPMFAVIGVSLWLAYRIGPAFEHVFFAGDLKAWTNGSIGTGLPFVSFLLFPLSLFFASFAFRRFFGERWRLVLRRSGRSGAGLVDFARWLAVLTIAALASLSFAWLFESLGFDPRGGIVDTYVQRNALVVGFVMGFAVIPTIYTLAEDALNAVPSHLRAASLAAGATPWQTALWVILPTALSGVFAAVMIGMGRAVGETMIVVMAAGNTPVLDWNIFNGMRTLSANIAVELPEAVQDGTLYRMLFLAGLSLFIMTFVINTVAEVIRLRFRKRAFQL
ncbi:MAG: ABC transporter permease subunit [Rhodospirillales bacterium]